jgi:hypothetical protein
MGRGGHRSRLWCCGRRELASAVLAAAIAIGTVQPAHAGDLDDQHQVELYVHGRIVEHCAMGSIPGMNFGDLTRANLAIATHVDLSCNVPFALTIEAANGGLTNDVYPHGQGPYAGSLPYTIGVSIPVQRPASGVVSGQFNSRDLVGGRTLSSAGGIALHGMALEVALGKPASEAGLLAGHYGEVITITVTPG